MAVPSASKQLQPQKGKDRLLSRDHLGSRESRLLKQPLQRDLSQIRDKQVQSPELGPELPDRKIQSVHIGTLGDLGPRSWEPFFVSPSGKPGKTFFFENQGNGNRTHPLTAFFQNPADIIDGQILLSQGDHFVSDAARFRRSLRSLLRRKEEGAIGMLTEFMGENTKTSRRIPEAMGDFGRREILDEVGPEGFILAMSGIGGFEKEVGHMC
jgi:hypothetical protein